MRIREVEYQGKRSLLVYITEMENTEFEALLEEWNRQYDSVVSYVSGNQDIKAALEQMVGTHALL